MLLSPCRRLNTSPSSTCQLISGAGRGRGETRTGIQWPPQRCCAQSNDLLFSLWGKRRSKLWCGGVGPVSCCGADAAVDAIAGTDGPGGSAVL